jgi:hypothetical protein
MRDAYPRMREAGPHKARTNLIGALAIKMYNLNLKNLLMIKDRKNTILKTF